MISLIVTPTGEALCSLRIAKFPSLVGQTEAEMIPKVNKSVELLREFATQLQTEADMIKAIREAGRTPVQRNTFYEPIKTWDAAPTATEAEPPLGKSKVLEDNLATA